MDKRWEKINSKIKSSDPAFREPDLPFKSDVIIKDFNELYSKIYDKEKFIAS